MLIQIDENSVTLTPFGSLIRITRRAGTLTRVGGSKSWSAKLRAVLALPLWLIYGAVPGVED